MQPDSFQTKRCPLFPTLVAFWLVSVAWLFVPAAFAVAEETLDEVAVRTLVRQLESRQAATREAAEQELRSLGPKALNFLPTINDGMSAELKARLQRIRDQLDRMRLEDSTKSSVLTLQGEMSLNDALATIFDQTSNQIVDYRGRIDGVSENLDLELDIKKESFWSAFDQFADVAGVTIYPYVGESRKLAIVAKSSGANPRFGAADYQGLFRVEVTSVACRRNLRDPSGDRMQLGLEVLWEPRVLPVLFRQNLQDVKVTTDTGAELQSTQLGTSQIPIHAGVASLDLQVPVSLPPREAKKLSSVKGKFVALVPGGDIQFEFDNLIDFKDSRQDRGGLSVSIDDVRMNRGLPQISVRVRFDKAGEAMQSHLDWVENNVVQLLDPEGASAGEPSYERYLERDGEVGFRYTFAVEDPDLTGWKLTYKSPAGIAEIPIEYELKDIRLP